MTLAMTLDEEDFPVILRDDPRRLGLRSLTRSLC